MITRGFGTHSEAFLITRGLGLETSISFHDDSIRIFSSNEEIYSIKSIMR
jgi:hypothetical protein